MAAWGSFVCRLALTLMDLQKRRSAAISRYGSGSPDKALCAAIREELIAL